MVYRSWGKKSFSDSDMFSWVELDPKFGILAFSAIFVLFFWVAKNLIYIDNAFNGYSYLKSTRKELSDGTLMLKKEYRLARWNCDWKSYTFPKNIPPPVHLRTIFFGNAFLSKNAILSTFLSNITCLSALLSTFLSDFFVEHFCECFF